MAASQTDASSGQRRDTAPTTTIASTPTPTAGWPIIHQQQALAWEPGHHIDTVRDVYATSHALPGTTCFVQPFSSELLAPEDHVPSADELPVHTLVQNVLRMILGCDTILVGRLPRDLTSSITPDTLYVRKLTPDAHEQLKTCGVISTRPVTFSYLPIKSTPPWAIFRIANGHFTDNDAKDTAAVRKAIIKAWVRPENVTKILDSLKWAPTLDAESSTKFKKWILTIAVKKWPFKTRDRFLAPFYSVYVEPPTDDPALWIAFRNVAQKIAFRYHDKTTTPTTLLDCLICHGADHSAGLCPFKTIPGYLGPSGDPRFKHSSAGPPPNGRSVRR
jgi:hypothetical protein